MSIEDGSFEATGSQDSIDKASAHFYATMKERQRWKDAWAEVERRKKRAAYAVKEAELNLAKVSMLEAKDIIKEWDKRNSNLRKKRK